MCGLVGVVSYKDVGVCLYDALTVLQHRGQDAAGIMTSDKGKLNLRKDNGLVKDVFHNRHMRRLTGQMGIGHVRYPTAGGSSPALAQPFYVNSPYGLSLAHNGNLTNSKELSRDLFKEDLRHINTDSDSEVLLNIFAHELQRRNKMKPLPEDIFAAVAGVHNRCRGGYVAIVMISGYGIVGFRDRNGIRPLVFGSRKSRRGTEYMIASESVALDSQGFTLERDVAPGEAVYIDVDGNLHSQICTQQGEHTPCIFEQVYFARPDSFIDDVNVYDCRVNLGRLLADEIKKHDLKIDIVVPVPDSARDAAIEIARKLNLKYREALVKNRYIGRTFIMPADQKRKASVRQKLNPIASEFKEKNVLLVDDSIVRGNTSRAIIDLVRECGTKKVYFAAYSPPLRFPCVYGIDMQTKTEFVAQDANLDQIAKKIGADKVIYQTLESLKKAVGLGNKNLKNFCGACFDGVYPTGDVTPEILKEIEKERKIAQENQLELKFY